MAEPASAQVLSFSGAAVALDYEYSSEPAGTRSAEMLIREFTVGVDLVGTPIEIQGIFSEHANVSGDLGQVVGVVGFQFTPNAKAGFYVDVTTIAGPDPKEFGILGMVQLGEDSYLDYEFGVINGNYASVGFAAVEYSYNGFFTELALVNGLRNSTLDLYGIEVGYEYALADNLELSAHVGVTQFGTTRIDTAGMELTVLFGGAASSSVDNRMFSKFDLFTEFPIHLARLPL